MKKGIDFLKAYEKKIEKEKNIIRLLSRGLILITLIYCIFSIGVFAYWQNLNQTLKDINNKINSKKTKIKQYQKRESLYFLLKDQLSFLYRITSGKEVNYSQIILSILQSAEDKVKISDIKISSNGETKISALAPTASSLASFLGEIGINKGMEGFYKITLSSLSKQRGGDYNFSMTFSYDKD
jgi:hypothetical protein